MATVNLGRIKPVFRGAYSGSTAYVVDDIVTHGNESFICIQAHGAGTQATSQTAYWTKLAAKGTDGTDVGTTITTQGDILYRDGSGLQRLAKGTAGQALKMNSGANAPEWGTISSGTYSVHAHDDYSYETEVANSSQTDYVDIAGGNTVNFTVTHADDLILFNHNCHIYLTQAANGVDVYLMMKASSASIGSGDTKLNYDGQHSWYYSQESSHHLTITKTFILKCTGLSVGTTYYVEQCGAGHNNLDKGFNKGNTNNQGFTRHFVQMIHYKKN